MPKARGSKKGSPFERDICRKLSLWWSRGESDSIFWRTNTSGARATVRQKKGKKTHGQHGDVCATDPSGQPFIDRFALELKKGYSRFTIADLFDSPNATKHPYRVWFEKIRESAKHANTPGWMLIVQRDRKEALIFMPQRSGWVIAPVVHFDFILDCRVNGMEICGFRLSEFLDRANPSDVLKIPIKE